MLKIDACLLRCKNPICHTIPTIVMVCKYPSGKREKMIFLTCEKDTEMFFEKACRVFGSQNLTVQKYPEWLRMLHLKILTEGKINGEPVKPEDIDMLRELIYDHRNPLERQ
jgi:hypothetical protein